MKKWFTFVLMVLCLAGGVFGLIMTVMAARFMEYGRFLFYGTIFLFCLSLFVGFLLDRNKS